MSTPLDRPTPAVLVLTGLLLGHQVLRFALLVRDFRDYRGGRL